MIRYDLNCDAGHAFDAWFPGSDAYDEQAARGLVTCPHCGTPKVSKAIMAPSVAKGGSGKGAADAGAGADAGGPDLTSGMPAELRQALREFRAKALEGSENVGMRFADEARRIHRGDAPARKVHGEATPDEARALHEEGVAVAPLPPDLGGH